jgi:hypothetical protein
MRRAVHSAHKPRRRLRFPQWTESGFRNDVRAVLRPPARWHWLLHLYVVIVASWYWISVMWAGGGASLAELVLYRPQGDTQIYPLIRALSEGNFGDPVDSLKYGQGIASFALPPLLPYAAACALFGEAGYILTDALMPWCYFVAVTVLLRACDFNVGAAAVTGALFASGAAGAAGAALGGWQVELFDQFDVKVWNQGWPNFFELPVYGSRIHRPQFTAIFLVLALYFLVKLWREERAPGPACGVAMGVTFSLLFQGEIYATASLGLLAIVVLARNTASNGWRIPWPFLGSAVAGALAVGWFLLVQRWFEHPDVARRFGLVDYPRWPPLWLPRYGWLIRIAVVLLLVGLVWWLARGSKGNSRLDDDGVQARSLAVFFGLLMIVAGLAQPIQILLLGKQIQIYHYLHNVSVFYAYGVVILGFHVARQLRARFPSRPGRVWSRDWRYRAILILMLAVGAWLATDEARQRHGYLKHPSGAVDLCHPWARYEDRYRPALRELDREFQRNSALHRDATFTTFNMDVFTLLTAFHGKRAFNPDVFASTLSDEEIEDRLVTSALLLQLSEQNFHPWLSHYHILNHFLGCNKYRLADDHRFSPVDEDYPPHYLHYLKEPWYPQQDGWVLVLPNSEGRRLAARYSARSNRLAADDNNLPDLVILSPEHQEQRDVFALHPGLYELIYNNEVFEVYRHLY